MIRIAIIDTEELAKEIMYEFASKPVTQEIVFYVFKKISEFALAQEEKQFHIVFFHEKFESARVSQTFVLDKPERLVIYAKSQLSEVEKMVFPFARIFYVDRINFKEDMKRIRPYIDRMLRNEEEYLFSYNDVEVPLKISDIVYLEKQDKYLIYHTKRGEFRERKSMKDANEYFKQHHFLWIHASYLVNMQHITQMSNDMVYLHKLKLPIARARKKEVVAQVRSYVKDNK